MRIFCKHKWEKIHERTEKSAFEQITPTVEISRADPWVFRKKHLVVFACKDCGKLTIVRQE